jgi:hypothetical protein
MKTAIEKFVDWLKEEHPDAVPTPEVLDRLKMCERLDQQMAYNAGFAMAKKIYNETNYSAVNHQQV